MRIPRFEMERFQSTWEPRVDYNLADSGVHPITLGALADEAWIREVLAQEAIGYGHTNGSPELRATIAELHHLQTRPMFWSPPGRRKPTS